MVALDRGARRRGAAVLRCRPTEDPPAEVAAAGHALCSQITIPADVRNALSVGTGDRVEFVQIEAGQFLFVAANQSVTELKGMFGKPAKAASIEDMNSAISARGASAR